MDVFSIEMPAVTIDVQSQLRGEIVTSLAPDVTTVRPADSRPDVLSLPLARWQIKTHSFKFPEPIITSPASVDRIALCCKEPVTEPPSVSQSLHKPRPSTRLKPPGDIVKLKDRLYFVLQPSIETLLADSSLDFPCVPFPYQFEGVAFLYPRVAAVLADEMGLGKTMQAITAIRMLVHAGEIRSVLLVCPKPLVTNWRREFGLWAPELPLAVIDGDQEKRRWQWQVADAPIKIANYEALNRDRRIVAGGDLHFDLVVLDESQRIKNRNSTTSHVVRAISRTRSWALTGTPVENSPEDLVGIFDFVAPGHLSADMKPRAMGRAAGEYVLRRTKDKVLTDLPPKLFRDAELELTPEQRHTYQLAEDEGVLRLSEMGNEATIHHVFELILRLKQICNFDPATGESAKLERLAADLEEVAASGQKAIVFSQWVESLQALGRRLRRFGTLEYHGQIPSRKRDAVIEQFRDDPSRHVLLMSYGAGGVGLNLQFAGYVFLFDRWWNPAVEDQAINRAHRIGQKEPVFVTRFIAEGTIERKIADVLDRKRRLFNELIESSDAPPQLGMTEEEIFGLFNIQSRPRRAA